MSLSSLRALRYMVESELRWASLNAPISPCIISSSGVTTMASGVRSSWVMLAKKRDLNSSSCCSLVWALSRFWVVTSRRSRCSCCSRSVENCSTCATPAMRAVAERKVMLETATWRSPPAPSRMFTAGKETTSPTSVTKTSDGGQTKSSPAASTTRIRPA